MTFGQHGTTGQLVSNIGSWVAGKNDSDFVLFSIPNLKNVKRRMSMVYKPKAKNVMKNCVVSLLFCKTSLGNLFWRVNKIFNVEILKILFSPKYTA